MSEAPRRRSTFGPVVLTGLAAAALATIASAKPWIGSGSSGANSDATMTAVDQGTRYPMASAVSLLLLASWGVLLVTRGVVRRGFAVIAALAALGLVAAVIAAYVTLPGSADSSFAELMGRASSGSGFTGWFWVAAAASLLALLPAAAAVRLVPTWPEMGTRYDAPGSHTPEHHVVETHRDLWNELDEGRDPTDPTDGADSGERPAPG